MLRVPELGCDEDVLTLEVGDLAAESLLEGLSDLLLVAIDLGEIKVAVASLEGLEDGGADLTRLSLPCAESKLARKISNCYVCLRGVCLGTHGMAAPVLRVTFLPRDMFAIGELGVSRRKSKEFVSGAMRMFWTFKRCLGKKLSEVGWRGRRRHRAPDGTISMFGSRLRASSMSDGPPYRLLRHALVRLRQSRGSRVSTSIIHRRYEVGEA